MELSSGDAGNSAVVVVSLAMSRMRSFAVNSRTAPWKTRCHFIWTGLLWYTSFHSQSSTFLTNQRNIALESVALLLLILRSDVPNVRRTTSEPNEHFYGLLRQLLREFKTDEFIHLVNKLMQKVNALFRGNLVPRRSPGVANGYLSTFPEWLDHMRAGSSQTNLPAGPVDVDLDMPAVNQLWQEFCMIVRTTNAVVVPFLKLFGVELGNGLSPFARAFDTPSDLVDVITNYFRPPASDPRDGLSEQNDDEQPEPDSDDEDDEASQAATSSAVSAVFLQERLDEIIALDADDDETQSGKDESGLDDFVEPSSNAEPFESFFDKGNADSALQMLRKMLLEKSIVDVPMHAYKLTQLLQLGKIEKGSASLDGAYKSLLSRWFGEKKKKKEEDDKVNDSVDVIERDTLIKLSVRKGGQESSRYYRVLGIFSKHYNKWFVEFEKDKKVTFDPQGKSWKAYSKKYKLLARMMKKTEQSDFDEVELKKDGEWSPKAVFRIVSLADVLSVEMKLASSNDDW